ncbi:hypothetical protein SHLO109777_11645 [Shewanella loihica]
MCWNFQLKAPRNILKHRDDLTMLFFIISLAVLPLGHQHLQLWQLKHPQTIKIAPTGLAKQVVNNLVIIPFSGKPFWPLDFGQRYFSFVFVFVGVEEFHNEYGTGFLGSGH